jgi:hypothetical protein
MRRALAIAALLLGLAAPLAAQTDSTAVRPGMSEADVRARWGDPLTVRHSGEWTFLYYANAMERRVGWTDVVFLQRGQVVNAIVRGAGRTYLGQSSAPDGAMPQPTRRDTVTDPNRPGAMTGVRMNP